VVFVLPTATDWAGFELPPWYTKHVTAKLQWGLDLQGGLQVVYEVEVDKAVSDKRDRLAADLQLRLERDKKVQVSISVEGRDEIMVQFKDPAQLKVFDDKFFVDFESNLDIMEKNKEKGEVRLRLDENYVPEVQKYAIAQAKITIQNRVDGLGVAEVTVLVKGRDIVIELPGLKEAQYDRVKNQIGRTAQLEFKMVDDDSTYMQQVAAKVPEGGPISYQTDSYRGKDQERLTTYVYLESKDRKALLDFLGTLESKGVPVPKTHEILLGEDQARDKQDKPLPEKVYKTYLVKRRAELTGEYISDALVQWDDQTGRPEVGLTFDRNGAELFEKLSGANVGKRMAIILDGKVNSAPVFQSRIGGGRARITLSGFRDPMALQNEAKDLVGVLRSGALPAPLRKTFERQVGPTLGEDAINSGKWAFIIGAGMVFLFMLYYYRGSGFVCDVALVLNILFMGAILAGFGATLTLPGIAGLVLTIGMAVDANVIIYERIREEEALGKTPRAAVDAGFGRAVWTVFDSQLTTAIAGFVLWQYGSGPIRGFAVTLLVGIVCSVFTAVTCTRLMLDFAVVKFKPKKLSI
jgi:preprotein translocase subunit SecD